MHKANHGVIVKSARLTVRDHLSSGLIATPRPNYHPSARKLPHLDKEAHPAATRQHSTSNLRPETIQELYNDKLKAGLSTATVRKVNCILHESLGYASSWQDNQESLDVVECPSLNSAK